MRHYVCAYIDWFDNELELTETFADDDVSIESVFRTFLSDHGVEISDDDFEEPLAEGENLLEWMKQECFNADCMCNILEIKETPHADS